MPPGVASMPPGVTSMPPGVTSMPPDVTRIPPDITRIPPRDAGMPPRRAGSPSQNFLPPRHLPRYPAERAGLLSCAAGQVNQSYATEERFLPDFDLKRLHDAPLDVSEIRCECKVWDSRRNHRRGGLVTFRGVYRPGSAGTDDARVIRWRMRQFYELYGVSGVVIDCRELDYVWGDDLDFPVPDLLHRTETFPLLVILRPEQVEAYQLHPEERRHDLHAALADVSDAIRAMKSLL